MTKITHLGPRDFGHGAMRMASWSPRKASDKSTFLTSGDGFVAVHTDYLARWQDDIQNAFDLGFKAAGGSISPDDPPGWQLVEIALTREEIDALAGAISIVTGAGIPDHIQAYVDHAHLSTVLEKISFFVRKPGG